MWWNLRRDCCCYCFTVAGFCFIKVLMWTKNGFSFSHFNWFLYEKGTNKLKTFLIDKFDVMKKFFNLNRCSIADWNVYSSSIDCAVWKKHSNTWLQKCVLLLFALWNEETSSLAIGFDFFMLNYFSIICSQKDYIGNKWKYCKQDQTFWFWQKIEDDAI